jgi:glucosamine-6-phosphate deaminase
VTEVKDAAGFDVEILPVAAEVGRRAAAIVAEAGAARPDLVLAMPTGSTPLPMFEELIARVERGDLDLSRVRLFCLDDFVGVTPDDPNSLTGWLRRVFVEPAGIPWERVRAVPADAPDPDAACAAYEADLAAAGGLDLAVLGLGPNGHIAYNEPGSAADSRTRTLDLTPESIAQATAYWQPGVSTPERGMTMGVGTLLEAKRIVLIVTGESKAGILRRSLEGPMSPEVPGSWLQLAAGKTTVVADEAAAADLSRK